MVLTIKTGVKDGRDESWKVKPDWLEGPTQGSQSEKCQSDSSLYGKCRRKIMSKYDVCTFQCKKFKKSF